MPTSDALRFDRGSDAATALALDLLVLPPHMRLARHCRRCASALPPRDDSLGDDGRHFVRCPYWGRTTCHDPARDALVALLDAVLGERYVVAERPGDRRAIDEWWERYGRGRLLHRPDIVLIDFDGPRTFTLIDVKTFDPCGATWVTRSHTDTTPRAAHHELERRQTPRSYFGPTGSLDPTDPLRPFVRLVTFSLSTFGSFGQPALDLLRDVGRRLGGHLPALLSDDASWAAFEFAPYARMRLSLAIRRALARSLRETACTDAEAAALRGRGAPPSDPSASLDAGPADDSDDE